MKSFHFIGPPLAPHPKFQVVNATHIEVKWDKPFTLPDFDVISYTLLVNTSFEGVSLRNQSFSVSANTTYPIRFYLSNGGDIPKECVYINFLLTAKNDAGESHIGSVMGGFPIGKLSFKRCSKFMIWSPAIILQPLDVI